MCLDYCKFKVANTFICSVKICFCCNMRDRLVAPRISVGSIQISQSRAFTSMYLYKDTDFTPLFYYFLQISHQYLLIFPCACLNYILSFISDMSNYIIFTPKLYFRCVSRGD